MSAPIALAGLAFAGSAISSRGRNQSAAAEQRAYESRAFSQELEAADQETKSLLEEAQTTFEAERLRTKIDRTRGSQMAAVASSGIEVSGSALQVIERDAAEQEFDVLMLRFGGNARAASAKRTAGIHRMNSDILKAEGRVARTSGRAEASSSLLTGAIGAANVFRGASGK